MSIVSQGISTKVGSKDEVNFTMIAGKVLTQELYMPSMKGLCLKD